MDAGNQSGVWKKNYTCNLRCMTSTLEVLLKERMSPETKSGITKASIYLHTFIKQCEKGVFCALNLSQLNSKSNETLMPVCIFFTE